MRDAANRALGLRPESEQEEIIQAMAKNPTLLQRPIGIHEGRAVLGRPPEKILELLKPI